MSGLTEIQLSPIIRRYNFDIVQVAARQLGGFCGSLLAPYMKPEKEWVITGKAIRGRRGASVTPRLSVRVPRYQLDNEVADVKGWILTQGHIGSFSGHRC